MSDPTKLPLTLETYFMGRDLKYPPTAAMIENAKALIAKVNLLFLGIAPEFKDLYCGITSGYRPGPFNKAAGGATRSPHLTCEAVDLADPTGELGRKLRAREDILVKAGLYMEHPLYCKTWTHLQTRKTKSRVFIPY